MGTEQETLIYIEDQDKLDASVAANAFAHKDVKNRAYINTLGAELALKYLASEDIDVSNISACARGKYKTAGGYIWRYTPDYLNN